MSYGEWSYENLLSDNEMYRRRIALLEKLQEQLIEWVQEDCPFSREKILSIATKNAGDGV